jgi:hypothetical protein
LIFDRRRALARSWINPSLALRALIVLGAAALVGGCTRESVRVAIETQRRADAVQQTVFERQHDALRILLYRDLVNRLEKPGAPLSAVQRAAVNKAWNDRDLVEFWAVQWERSKALRLIGVDAKLYSDQSIVDLLYKSLAAKAQRAKEGIAAQVGSGFGVQGSENQPSAADGGGR